MIRPKIWFSNYLLCFQPSPADVVKELIEGMVETYPHLTYLDGFPEVKSIADVLFDCAFAVSKSTVHEHIACHVGT